MKKYKAIFFDWDGTAVLSRQAPVEKTIKAMRPLLQKGIKLIIVSGTTIENIAGGHIESYFTPEELQHLYLGLGRGAYNYAFLEDGTPYIFQSEIPKKQVLINIHQVCFEIHKKLLEQYDFMTDIVFSRPNYCKIDLMVYNLRGENLFLQANELDLLRNSLAEHGITNGLQGLIDLAIAMGNEYGLSVIPTCDAKYLEVGLSSKSTNVNTILSKIAQNSDIAAKECAFWGDEYVGLEEGIFGSDSFMQTEVTALGDFFDVSDMEGERPVGIKKVGGGVQSFLQFLREEADR